MMEQIKNINIFNINESLKTKFNYYKKGLLSKEISEDVFHSMFRDGNVYFSTDDRYFIVISKNNYPFEYTINTTDIYGNDVSTTYMFVIKLDLNLEFIKVIGIIHSITKPAMTSDNKNAYYLFGLKKSKDEWLQNTLVVKHKMELIING